MMILDSIPTYLINAVNSERLSYNKESQRAVPTIRYHYDATVNAYLTSKKANVLFHYIWFQLYNLCIPFYFIFHVAWAYYGLMHHWKMILTHASNSNRLLVPHFGTSTDLLHLWAHWVRVFVSVRLSSMKKANVLHPFSHRFLQTDTNKNQTIAPLFFTTYARNTLCLPRFPYIFHPSIHPTILFRTTIVDRSDTTDTIR